MLSIFAHADNTCSVTILPQGGAGTPGVMSLNGTWRFLMLPQSQDDNCPAGWLSDGFDDAQWSEIHVPGNWETQGFKRPEYGADLSSLTGLYRTTFKYQPEWNGKEVILRFEGVHMGYECWVNERHAGSFGSASNPCNFDITPLLRDGKNVLCVKVSTRSHAWRFDTVDNWTYTGINRDVTLFAIPRQHIDDLTFISENCHGNEADIRVRLKVKNAPEGALLRLSLQNEEGVPAAGFSKAVPQDGVCELAGHLKNISLWTAETPRLYSLDAALCDAQGRVLHRVTRRVGLREITTSDRELRLNGTPILLKGVCVSEAHPYLGNAFTPEEWRKQLLLMKKAHINFIRTAHYPMHPALYDLCDELGFYVCDEIPLASRGGIHLTDSAYQDEIRLGTEYTVARDKNHPCVIIWSIGNENKTIASSAATHVKEIDPTRLRGFPQISNVLFGMMGGVLPDVNVLMGHYLNDKQLDYVQAHATLPFIQTEYSHSLGLGFGDFEKKWERILKTKGFAGGSIWCWMDGAAITSRPQTKVLKGLVLDSLHYLDSYGYIKKQGEPERGKEANDGIIYAEGTPQEDYWLVRKLYSPVQIDEDTLSFPLRLTVRNGYSFRSLEGFTAQFRTSRSITSPDFGACTVMITASKGTEAALSWRC